MSFSDITRCHQSPVVLIAPLKSTELREGKEALFFLELQVSADWLSHFSFTVQI
jgi:hypothetical protein